LRLVAAKGRAMPPTPGLNVLGCALTLGYARWARFLAQLCGYDPLRRLYTSTSEALVATVKPVWLTVDFFLSTKSPRSEKR
jgi:hypothetical protein